jgi:hypothetical protein
MLMWLTGYVWQSPHIWFTACVLYVQDHEQQISSYVGALACGRLVGCATDLQTCSIRTLSRVQACLAVVCLLSCGAL